MEHKFIKEIDGEWMVYCEETTGSFCTSLWTKGIFLNQICPYCNRLVRRYKNDK
jgi:hypothetical protein